MTSGPYTVRHFINPGRLTDLPDSLRVARTCIDAPPDVSCKSRSMHTEHSAGRFGPTSLHLNSLIAGSLLVHFELRQYGHRIIGATINHPNPAGKLRSQCLSGVANE